MKMILEKENFLKSNIRDIIAVNPLVSIRKVQELVEHNTGRPISDKYTSKLMYKIRREAVIQSDRKKMNERLAEVRELYRVLMDDLKRRIYWKPEFSQQYGLVYPSFKERIACMKLLGQMELALFRAELDVGMFENKQLALDEMLQRGVLPGELSERVVGVFRSWKLGVPAEKEYS